MFVGARVAYAVANKARVGVVMELDGDRALLRLDNAQEIPVRTDRLRLVNFWQDRVRDRDVDEFRYYPEGIHPIDIFNSNKAIKFGKAAMLSMWLWINQNIFSSELKLPEFRVSESARGRSFGRCKYLGRGKGCRIYVTGQNHNIGILFNTMLHEMIHQYNFEIDYEKKREYDPNSEGTHGAAFFKWVSFIRDRTSVIIDITAGDKDDTEFGEISEATTKPFIFVLFRPVNNWLGFIVKNEDDLDTIDGEMGSYLRRIKARDSRVYAGISNLSRVRNAFANAGTNGRINLKTIKSAPPIAIIKLAVNTAKPVDGWELPKQVE